MRQITDKELKKRLVFDNPWWEDGVIDPRFRDMKHRAYFDGFAKLVMETEVKRAVVLMGPRRVGKTVMIHQTIQRLMETGISENHILYVSVDTPVYTGMALEKLLELFMELHGHSPKGSLYVFFDEIQYHLDWERHLKSLVDSYPDIRLVVSGSSAAALKLKSLESGAGRFTDFVLPPLTFAEFLDFEDLTDQLFDKENDKRRVPRDIESLNEAFIDYLNYGGFPEAVFEKKVRHEMSRYVANDIIDKVLLRDLPSLYGISDPQELNRLFTVIAYNTGFEVNIDELSKQSQVTKNTIKKYLEYLEAAFLIRRIYRVDHNAKRFKKQTHFKIYLANPSLRSALFGAVDSDDPAMGQLAETAIVSQFAHSAEFGTLHYARWKAGRNMMEVDLVMLDRHSQRLSAEVEIKWSDRAAFNPRQELAGLLAFCRKNNLKEGQVSTRSFEGMQDIDGIRVYFTPIAVDCWSAGRFLVYEELEKGSHPLTGLLIQES